jgi:acylphosphatase
MKKCSQIVVRGKVQGVLYRDFVKKSAQKCLMEGTIQNSPDGTVVIKACGPTKTFDNFIDALYKGSPKSNVEEIREEPLNGLRNFRGVFRIIGAH